VPDHRFFSAIYDRMLAGTERAGLAEMRAELVAQAEGRTLELGAGTGLNLAHYGPAVSELILTEPDRFMARRLRARVAETDVAAASVEVIEAPAEELPVDHSSVDTVVSTLVLCTVADPDRASVEVARVLRPGGRMLVLEHVVSPDNPRVARWQHRLRRPWSWFGAGCNCNRDTRDTLAAAGFAVEALDRDELPKAPPIVRPLIVGPATHSG
jgi:ubiquinone/menaquinone biosynthesis C-methylase UbiE